MCARTGSLPAKSKTFGNTGYVHTQLRVLLFVVSIKTSYDLSFIVIGIKLNSARIIVLNILAVLLHTHCLLPQNAFEFGWRFIYFCDLSSMPSPVRCPLLNRIFTTSLICFTECVSKNALFKMNSSLLTRTEIFFFILWHYDNKAKIKPNFNWNFLLEVFFFLK